MGILPQLKIWNKVLWCTSCSYKSMKWGTLWGALTPGDTLASSTSSWVLIWAGDYVPWKRDPLKRCLCDKWSLRSVTEMPLLFHRTVVRQTTILDASSFSFIYDVSFLARMWLCWAGRKKPHRFCEKHWKSCARSQFSPLLQACSWDSTRILYSSYRESWLLAHLCPSMCFRSTKPGSKFCGWPACRSIAKGDSYRKVELV